ncbi:hypothetical protein CZ674_01440 [Agrococcus casei LMG 22410]|uniref:Uncharacterized protein n=1 Tax=Agrococcus casei LMG 22410 TaxID=1255656 RepID=A0A1R4EXH3_9MICO|nr:hypothetical protein CZ674_01440 [Agrococcus casei LMG 22410]
MCFGALDASLWQAVQIGCSLTVPQVSHTGGVMELSGSSSTVSS